MADTADIDEKKTHRPRQAGKKADKKKSKEQTNSAERKNPKAFAIQSVNKAAKQARRGEDLETKKHHIPLVDRKSEEPPPIVVCVVGPPKVGKTTLIQNLIKNYTKEKISDLKGPVTVVSGKKQRLTLIECPNDVNYMIDIAKVADLVLLLIDASFGFEMEIFEFLNIAQVHGFPKIMGVLTHLDLLKKNKSMQKIKKQLKQRFWTEVYQGAKLFYLSNINHGLYPKTEVSNLARFIQVMKYRPLAWRSSHSYMLIDRFEDITDPNIVQKNEKCDRTIRLYGYMRGAHLKYESKIHIVGCGDYPVKSIHLLPDPCPLPDKEKKRSLSEKEKLVFAPMSGVGGIIYDKDAVYIDLGGSKAGRQATKNGDEAKENNDESGDDGLVSSIHSLSNTIDTKMDSSGLSIFKKSIPVTAENVRSDMKWTNCRESIVKDDNGVVRRKAVFDDDGDMRNGDEYEDDDDEDGDDEVEDDATADDGNSDSDGEDGISDDDEDSGVDGDICDFGGDGKDEKAERDDLLFEDNDSDIDENDDSEKKSGIKVLAENLKSKLSGFKLLKGNTDIRSIVYKNSDISQEEKEMSDGNELIGDMFLLKRGTTKGEKTGLYHKFDCSKQTKSELVENELDELIESIKNCFTKKVTENAMSDMFDDDGDEEFGDFEDLEAMDENISDVEDEDDEGKDGELNNEKEGLESKENKRAAKKRKIKEMFNQDYDENKSGGNHFEDLKNEMNQQSELNKREFENLEDDVRVQYEGFRAGLYVHLEVENIPCEFVTNFNPVYPVILGGLLPGEDTIGYIQTRFKKHRWYGKILKNRDPLIVSIGWRRFQTIPLYSMQDHNGRYRALKYTPEHLHCIATIYGPVVPPNSGVLAIQHGSKEKFKIAATGVILDSDKSVQVVKKLKLVGTPLKVYKNTAFIKGMFTSSLEVTKFEGASIRTVSGIRGEIKKAVKAPNGAFRATFEDKILMSDIVFCRTWYPLTCPQYYNPVPSLLLPKNEKSNWNGMKTVGQLRAEKNIKLTLNKDSLYKPIERQVRKFNPVSIPKKLQGDLPFKSKPKNLTKAKKKNYEQRRAVVMESDEKKAFQLMKGIFAINREKKLKEKAKRKEQHQKFVKKMSDLDAKRDLKIKEQRKRIHKILGQEEKRKQKQMAKSSK